MNETRDKKDYYAVTFGGEAGFNNKNHIQNHIAYLCRTDKKQKWTNELTALNLAYIFGKTEDFITFGYEKEARFDIAAQIKSQITLCGAFKDKNVLKHLIMQRTEYINESIRVFDDVMLSDLYTVVSKIKILPDIVPIALVTHCDQTDCYVHFHLLYLSYSKTPIFELLCSALPE